MYQAIAKEGLMAIKEVASEGVSITKASFADAKEKVNPSELLDKNNNLGLGLEKDKVTVLENKLENIEIIKETSNYSENINEFIRNPMELKVYENANLQEGIVNDRVVLKTDEINPSLTDSMNRTNIDRMNKGLSPIDEIGNSYNLHHIGQKANSPLAELSQSEHNIYDSVLHDKTIKTEIHSDNSEVNWSKERSDHWKARAQEIEGIQNV